jgi:hypothetical protein
MFQYAFALALRDAQPGTRVLIDRAEYVLSWRRPSHNKYGLSQAFGIRDAGYFGGKLFAKLLETIGLAKLIRTQALIYNPELLTMHHRGILFHAGYWQSEKYFLPFAERLRQIFRFRVPESVAVRAFAEEMKLCTSVALHIRRTDYQKQSDLYRDVYREGYYGKAIAFIKEHVASPVFFIFSDDIVWCREHFVGPEFRIVEHAKGELAHTDMYLMTQCKHVITANSTFSWWGAWLNANPQKIVVSPKEWFASPKIMHNMADILPPEWQKL